METSRRENVISMWLIWQFYEMPSFLLQVWNNYFMFATNYFSLPLLLKTFFSPWRRYKWRYPNALDIVEFFNTLISNTFSRILGAIMRTVLIITGVLFQIYVVLLGLIVFVAWMAIPVAIIAGFIFIFI